MSNSSWQNLADSRFYVGIDLGQSQDYTALSIIEKRGVERQTCHCHVVALERYELGTSYAGIVEDLAKRLEGAPSNTKILIDKTGVGAGVHDFIVKHPGLAKRRSQIHGILIHGGDAESSADNNCFRVPKRDLVSSVQILLQSGRLKIGANLRETPAFLSELKNFKVKINPATAHDSYSSWRDAEHDDLVLSVSLACWGALHPRWQQWRVSYNPRLHH